MDYKEKLKQFNSTPKYKTEIDFLLKLIQPKEREKILDYGCGLGNLVHKIRNEFNSECFGYDVNNYRENDDEYLFKSNYFFKFDKVYFMHSIAHVPEIEQKLLDLKLLLNPDAKIYVITPNKCYLDCLLNVVYAPDPTVIKHRYMHEWIDVFESAGFEIENIGQIGEFKIRKSTEVNERLFLTAKWKSQ